MIIKSINIPNRKQIIQTVNKSFSSTTNGDGTKKKYDISELLENLIINKSNEIKFYNFNGTEDKYKAKE